MTLRDGPAIRSGGRGAPSSCSVDRHPAGSPFWREVAFVLALGAGLYLCAIGGLL